MLQKLFDRMDNLKNNSFFMLFCIMFFLIFAENKSHYESETIRQVGWW